MSLNDIDEIAAQNLILSRQHLWVFAGDSVMVPTTPSPNYSRIARATTIFLRLADPQRPHIYIMCIYTP